MKSNVRPFVDPKQIDKHAYIEGVIADEFIRRSGPALQERVDKLNGIAPGLGSAILALTRDAHIAGQQWGARWTFLCIEEAEKAENSNPHSTEEIDAMALAATKRLLAEG